MSSNASNQEFTIWLEQYKQVKDDIRNYYSIHWQIASVLYILMGFFIGYGLPNVAEGWGVGLVCFSTLCIFILHITTFYYFRELKNIKSDKLTEITVNINEIMIGIHTNNKRYFLEAKLVPMSFLNRYHPVLGFIIIFSSLAILAVALWQFPKNNQNFNQLPTISNLTKPSGNETTNHLEMITSPILNP